MTLPVDELREAADALEAGKEVSADARRRLAQILRGVAEITEIITEHDGHPRIEVRQALHLDSRPWELHLWHIARAINAT